MGDKTPKLTQESDLAPEFLPLLGASIVGFTSHKCHNGCSDSPDDESDFYEDGIVVEKDGKRYIISVVYCPSIPVEVEDSAECIMLSAGEIKS